MHSVYLTFDVEDFINNRSMESLEHILNLMNRNELRGLFFITGQFSEKLIDYPEIVNLLRNHEVGYHSNTHTTRPLIPEFTDIPDYNKAMEISYQRETSKIDSLNGKIISDCGGLITLRELFPEKDITSFRAPGLCWTGPHLEAIKKLGINFDFSTAIDDKDIVYYKGLTFYPVPTFEERHINAGITDELIESLTSKEITVLDIHPCQYVNSGWWCSMYYDGNPKKYLSVPPISSEERRRRFSSLESFLKKVSNMERDGTIVINPKLEKSRRGLNAAKMKVFQPYSRSVFWAEYFFKYRPKYLFSHFCRFFELKNARIRHTKEWLSNYLQDMVNKIK